MTAHTCHDTEQPPRCAGGAFVVNDLAGACTALHEAVQLGQAPLLLSAPGAALYCGPAWWRALIEAAQRRTGIACADALDCGNAAGAAFAALRCGCKLLVLDGSAPGFGAVAAAAATLGAAVLAERPRTCPADRA